MAARGDKVKHDLPVVEMEDIEWEEGFIPASGPSATSFADGAKEVTLEFDYSPDSPKRKPARRVSPEEKEHAEIRHKVHLLCLLARGRLIDNACDDPLIQASLLSLLPTHLMKSLEVTRVTTELLTPLVNWIHNNFTITCDADERRSFSSALGCAIEAGQGTSEVVAALSVALFRAQNLNARFVSILEVDSLKPDFGDSRNLKKEIGNGNRGIFGTSTVMVRRPKVIGCSSNTESGSTSVDVPGETNIVDDCSASLKTRPAADSEIGPKRKGDLELEMQLEMALVGTAISASEKNMSLDKVNSGSPCSNPYLKRVECKGDPSSSSRGISTAVGSKRVGPAFNWAEVYCSGGHNLAGKWVHVDVVNSVIDGEQNVEAAALACKSFLRYVVAFAGNGVKDVTRRYCMKWYKISPHRVNSDWWDPVLRSLKISDSRRDSMEDMELETRALTEPLPTNQQAYKMHQLYAIERWLTKYQVLHPKGPILGFCSGHAVYPRTCVQTLKTERKWLREGFQLKPNEHPVKVLENTSKPPSEVGILLYGQWQVEPLCVPPAVNGIVPKNEWGRVDVWCERCLPPGTVHLRLPRVASVIKRLGIDFAPAMVGFERRNGRSVPVYDGIVVCSEFQDGIMEAYAEEERMREDEERRRVEGDALSRWYQLVLSMMTRERLKNCYQRGREEGLSGKVDDVVRGGGEKRRLRPRERKVVAGMGLCGGDSEGVVEHEHVYLEEDESFDDEISVRTKRCRCGFSVEVEEF